MLSLAVVLPVLAGRPQPVAAAYPTYWTDSGIRAASFSSKDDTNKVLNITSAAELGLFAYLADAGCRWYGNVPPTVFAGWTINLTGNIDLSAHYWLPVNLRGYEFNGWDLWYGGLWFEANYLNEYNYRDYSSDASFAYRAADKIAFNGGGFTISGLKIVDYGYSVMFITMPDWGDGRSYGYFPTCATGLFTGLFNAAVTDLVIDRPSIDLDWGRYSGPSSLSVGIVAGTADVSEIRRVQVKDPDVYIELGVYSGIAVGGIVGYATNVTRLNDVSVTGGSLDFTNYGASETGSFLGGIAGLMFKSSVMNGASDTTLNYAFPASARSYVGGIAGAASMTWGMEETCIYNSYARSDINLSFADSTNAYTYYDYYYGYSYELHAGGIAGYLEDSAINNFYTPRTGGGIKVTRSAVTAALSANTAGVSIGELFGEVVNPGSEHTIKKNYYSGAVSALSGGKPIGRGSASGYTIPYTTATTLLALLSAGREDCADGIIANGNTASRADVMKLIRHWGIDATKNGGLPIFMDPVGAAPQITGTVSATLEESTAASVGTYTITGSPAPIVSLSGNTGGGKITWNNGTKNIDIAAGLTAGTYSVTLTASNGVAPDATLTVTLEVSTKADKPQFLGGNFDKLLPWILLGGVLLIIICGLLFTRKRR